MTLALALLLALGCAEPDTVAGCAGLRDATAREECRYRLVAPLTGDAAALDAALDAIEDPASRDLLLLRLAIAEPARASRQCARVTTDGAAEKCTQVLGRPHLSTTRKPPRRPPEGAVQAPSSPGTPPPEAP